MPFSLLFRFSQKCCGQRKISDFYGKSSPIRRLIELKLLASGVKKLNKNHLYLIVALLKMLINPNGVKVFPRTKISLLFVPHFTKKKFLCSLFYVISIFTRNAKNFSFDDFPFSPCSQIWDFTFCFFQNTQISHFGLNCWNSGKIIL